MKIKIKIILVSLGLVFFVLNDNSIWAQQTKSKSEVTRLNTSFFKDLELNKLQQKKLVSILKHYKNQKLEIEKERSKKVKRKKNKVLKKQIKEAIEGILRDDQKSKLKNQKRKKIRKLVKHHK